MNPLYYLLDELKKYKTTNINHQGDLYEHSIWSCFYSILLLQKIQNKYNTKFNKNFIFSVLLASLLHDIGKSGDCQYTDINNGKIEKCKKNIINSESIFQYETISKHPEIGYRYLKNKKYYKFSDDNLNFNKKINFGTYLENITIYYDIDTIFTKIISVGISCHYSFGITLLNHSDIDIKYIEKYINEIYIIYSDFCDNIFNFNHVILLTVVVSISDILASHIIKYLNDKVCNFINDIFYNSNSFELFYENYFKNSLYNIEIDNSKIKYEDSFLSKSFDVILEHSFKLLDILVNIKYVI